MLWVLLSCCLYIKVADTYFHTNIATSERKKTKFTSVFHSERSIYSREAQITNKRAKKDEVYFGFSKRAQYIFDIYIKYTKFLFFLPIFANIITVCKHIIA